MLMFVWLFQMAGIMGMTKMNADVCVSVELPGVHDGHNKDKH